VTTAWIDVYEGRRRLDWTVCFGDLANADYLTPLGRQAGARAASSWWRSAAASAWDSAAASLAQTIRTAQAAGNGVPVSEAQ
jgi:hypothetical protein